MEVGIPKAIEEECCAGKKTLDALMIQKAVRVEDQGQGRKEQKDGYEAGRGFQHGQERVGGDCPCSSREPQRLPAYLRNR